MCAIKNNFHTDSLIVPYRAATGQKRQLTSITWDNCSDHNLRATSSPCGSVKVCAKLGNKSNLDTTNNSSCDCRTEEDEEKVLLLHRNQIAATTDQGMSTVVIHGTMQRLIRSSPSKQARLRLKELQSKANSAEVQDYRQNRTLIRLEFL